jgi:hypothetical protein
VLGYVFLSLYIKLWISQNPLFNIPRQFKH